MNNKALHKLTYGLFILTAHENGKDNGCIVNTVTQVTSSPNRITVAVNKNNYTCGMISRTGIFNVSVLTADSKFDTYRHWGFQSGADTDKCENITFERADNGVIYIADECNAYICAKVVSATDLGTHVLFLADVCDAEILGDGESVNYAYYQKNIKPAAKKEERKKGFICTVCGYIYEAESLPADFVCPICKHPASDFAPL